MNLTFLTNSYLYLCLTLRHKLVIIVQQIIYLHHIYLQGKDHLIGVESLYCLYPSPLIPCFLFQFLVDHQLHLCIQKYHYVLFNLSKFQIVFFQHVYLKYSKLVTSLLFKILRILYHPPLPLLL